MEWPEYDASDDENETTILIYLVDNHPKNYWKFKMGWQWVADELNGCCGNNRTSEECKEKYDSI